MSEYFTRERFGGSQFLAGLLLLAFFAQAAWLVHSELRGSSELDEPEAVRIGEGWKQWHGHGIAAAPFTETSDDATVDPLHMAHGSFDTERSPLLYLVSAAPLMAWPRRIDAESAAYWRWLPRLPFLACGVFLGASLWYVARRLCGNTGGFVALTLYCFSPTLIQSSAVWHTEPEIIAAWGAFGTIFTAIAVAHTLYAPREVVLWNWRRIVLLGVSLAIAVGSQFSLVIVVPMALAFLLYLAPVRRGAGFVIWMAASMAAVMLLFAVYFFHAHAFAGAMRNAEFWAASWRGFAVLGVYKEIARQISRACPALAFLLPVAVITYCRWPRTRYFGNTAPLIVVALFLALTIANPHAGGSGFLLAAMPFLFIFVSGVLADLMETRYRPLVTACILGILLAYAAWSVFNLAQVPQG
jgi:hypothetical protein